MSILLWLILMIIFWISSSIIAYWDLILRMIIQRNSVVIIVMLILNATCKHVILHLLVIVIMNITTYLFRSSCDWSPLFICRVYIRLLLILYVVIWSCLLISVNRIIVTVHIGSYHMTVSSYANILSDYFVWSWDLIITIRELLWRNVRRIRANLFLFIICSISWPYVFV